MIAVIIEKYIHESELKNRIVVFIQMQEFIRRIDN